MRATSDDHIKLYNSLNISYSLASQDLCVDT